MTIQYIMLVSLGFLIASLITLLLAPLFWQRAVRLTSKRLRQSLPLTEQEILADKDQLRAKYAIRVHQLEKQAEHASLGAARQKIDLNRRDASIGQLETDLVKLRAKLEESANARSVLEQTVSDRIPKIEARLEEARKLLVLRDREISDLSQSSRRQQEALNEARVINQKQASDIERLRSQVLAHDAQSRQGTSGGDAEGELAVRTELEILRSRSREQASMIDRLNAEISVSRSNAEAKAAATPAEAAAAAAGAIARDKSVDSAELVASLRREVAVLQAQIEQAKAVQTTNGAGNAAPTAGESSIEREVRAITAKAEDQAAEITRLRAEIAAFSLEQGSGDNAVPSLRDNRIALKARLSGLEAKSNQQAETVQRLRAELAQTNERAARQAASFMDEMRRLGLAAHVTQPRTGRSLEAASSGSVARRTQALFEASRGLAPANSDVVRAEPRGGLADTAANAQSGGQPGAQPLARRLVAAAQKGLENGSGAHASQPAAEALAPTPARVSNLVAALRGSVPVGSAGNDANGEIGTATQASDEAQGAAPAARQPRLLDRITSADNKS